jgi:hypothetical protein
MWGEVLTWLVLLGLAGWGLWTWGIKPVYFGKDKEKK